MNRIYPIGQSKSTDILVLCVFLVSVTMVIRTCTCLQSLTHPTSAGNAARALRRSHSATRDCLGDACSGCNDSRDNSKDGHRSGRDSTWAVNLQRWGEQRRRVCIHIQTTSHKRMHGSYCPRVLSCSPYTLHVPPRRRLRGLS